MQSFKLVTATLRICANRDELTRCLAYRFTALAEEAAAKQGRFTVALSGGSTPKTLYSLLVEPAYRERIPWKQTHLFWGDERCVSHDSPDSNYKMVREALLTSIDIPPANVHPTSGQDVNPEQAALDYENTIKEVFGLSEGALPRFDLILLGLGPDGHTASLFPETAALAASDRLVVANYVAKFNAHRLTLTLPVLNYAAHIIFMVAGEDKSEILPLVLQSDDTVYPAQLVRPRVGTLEWYVDQAAVKFLDTAQLVPTAS